MPSFLPLLAGCQLRHAPGVTVDSLRGPPNRVLSGRGVTTRPTRVGWSHWSSPFSPRGRSFSLPPASFRPLLTTSTFPALSRRQGTRGSGAGSGGRWTIRRSGEPQTAVGTHLSVDPTGRRGDGTHERAQTRLGSPIGAVLMALASHVFPDSEPLFLPALTLRPSPSQTRAALIPARSPEGPAEEVALKSQVRHWSGVPLPKSPFLQSRRLCRF